MGKRREFKVAVEQVVESGFDNDEKCRSQLDIAEVSASQDETIVLRCWYIESQVYIKG